MLHFASQYVADPNREYLLKNWLSIYLDDSLVELKANMQNNSYKKEILRHSHRPEKAVMGI